MSYYVIIRWKLKGSKTANSYRRKNSHYLNPDCSKWLHKVENVKGASASASKSAQAGNEESTPSMLKNYKCLTLREILN